MPNQGGALLHLDVITETMRSSHLLNKIGLGKKGLRYEKIKREAKKKIRKDKLQIAIALNRKL